MSSAWWQIAPAVVLSLHAAPHLGGLDGSKVGHGELPARVGRDKDRQAQCPPRGISDQPSSEAESFKQSREGALRLQITPTDPREASQHLSPGCAVSAEQGYWLEPSLGKTGKNRGGVISLEEAITWGKEGDSLHQHILLLMKLQLLQHVVELHDGIQQKFLEAT